MPGSWNMALDQYLLDMIAGGNFGFVFRTYGWNPPCVSIGRFQDPEREIDPGKLLAASTGIVRRPTGGRAVLHSSEITYSVLAPVDHPLVSGSIDESLRKVAEPLIEALGSVGIEALINHTGRHLAGSVATSNPCFTSHGRSEITTSDGRKLIGSAQARSRGVFLEHGSILLCNEQSRLADFLPQGIGMERRELLRKSLSEGTGALREIVPDLDRNELQDALVEAFSNAADEVVHGIPLEELETAEFRELRKEKESFAKSFLQV
jgi:lipoate-protein ligase A